MGGSHIKLVKILKLFSTIIVCVDDQQRGSVLSKVNEFLKELNVLIVNNENNIGNHLG